MHEHRPHEAQRYALELVIPAQKRRHGRGYRPERAIPLGVMATSPANNAEGAPEAVVYDCGRLGDYKPIQRRRRLPDGTRSRLRPQEPPEGARLAKRADMEAEWQARMVVERAITYGVLELPHGVWRVSLTLTGAIRTIPDKGPVLKWASVEDLVQAIATGAI